MMLRTLLVAIIALGGLWLGPQHRGIAAISSDTGYHTGYHTQRVPGVVRAELAPIHGRDNSPGGRALVLEPFATELQLPPGAGDVEVSDLQSTGYQVDQAYDTDVTVNMMASLSGYNVVYMHTHSGPDLGGVVASGEPATGDPSLAPLLADGSVITVKVAGSTQRYYGITSRFILNHEGRFPPNSLLFLNGCSLLGSATFWQALASKGLGVLVSWDGESSVKDNYLAAAAFFNEMDQGMTVAQAIAAEEAAGYGKSTVNGHTATLGYVGDGTITLQSSVASPSSPTPTDTATSSPQPSTPSPTPTETPTSQPVSGPPLSLTLKQRVNPGSRQVLTARSSPNVTVHFRVVFPTGDHFSAKVKTDGSGMARYSYVQAPHMIGHGHVFATVTVEVTNGTATTTRTERYRIGWDKIDVSVEPAAQSPGQAVTIWVHTRPHMHVTVSLSVPLRGTIGRWGGRTSAGGWLRLRYRIRPSLQASRGQLLTVRASVRLSGRLYHTVTRITIL